MNTLLRRVAMALALPLAVGTPVVLLGTPANADEPVITVSTSVEEAIVYGQPVTATAQVLDGETPVTQGSVQFYVGLGEAVDELGARVPLDVNGLAVSPLLAQEDGRPLDVTDYYSDHWVIRAVYVDGADQPTALEHSVSLDVGKADSSIAVQTTATTLVADINGRLPGGVQANSFLPDDGVVHFKVDGQPVGAPATAENGRATISYVLQPGTHTITATYDGDGRYNPASETSSRKDPLLSARVLATFPRSKAGWYRTTVEVFFVCRPQGSEVDGCPADVTLRRSGKDQSLTRTIHAADGGTATVTVGNIDIDRVKPTITVDGRSCTATDKLSGVRGTCHLHLGQDGSYRAVALDRAGNRAVKHGVLD